VEKPQVAHFIVKEIRLKLLGNRLDKQKLAKELSQ
jgi:hypothetical protein